MLLGFGLTALFAFAAREARERVENDLVESLLNRNIDEYARRFYVDPDNVSLPVQQMYGRVVARTNFQALRAEQPEWYALGDGIHTISGLNEDGTPFSYKLAVRKTAEEWFFLAYDMSETVKGQEQFERAIIASVLVFSLLSLLVGWWAASKVMRPVSDLAWRLRGSGEHAAPTHLAPHFADDEVGELARALDDYSGRLTEVVQRDREFNADVSHELRTPLAVIKGAVELLLSRPDVDERTRTRLLRIQRAEEQCTDLISALLLLSRNERGQGRTDVARVAEQLLDAYRAQLGGKPLQLRMEGAVGGLVVDAPESTVSVALGNLIGNAVKYTREGEVVVRIGSDRTVQVADTGPGLSHEDAAKLFERGYRGSHAEHTQGGGIGLSIVRRLCALYGWQVRVVPGSERGVVATLDFADRSASDADAGGEPQSVSASASGADDSGSSQP